MDFDDPHFLMYEFWIRDKSDAIIAKQKVYLDGRLEGFPPGTVIINNASGLVGWLQAIIRKQNRPSPLVDHQGSETDP